MGKPGGWPQLGILEKVFAGERAMLSGWCHNGNSLHGTVAVFYSMIGEDLKWGGLTLGYHSHPE